MPAPTALVSIRTGTPDATNGVQLPTVEAQENSAYKIPGGVALSRQMPANASADRTVTAADSATDLSAGAGAFGETGRINVNNAGAIAVVASFESASDSASVRLAYYDGHSTPNPMFLGPVLSFVPSATLRKSSSGHYLSEPQIVESYGAASVKPYVVTKGNAVDDLSLWVFPL